MAVAVPEGLLVTSFQCRQGPVWNQRLNSRFARIPDRRTLWCPCMTPAPSESFPHYRKARSLPRPLPDQIGDPVTLDTGSTIISKGSGYHLGLGQGVNRDIDIGDVNMGAPGLCREWR